MDKNNGEIRHPQRKKTGNEIDNSYESLTDESIVFHLAKEAIRRKSPTAKTVKILR